jgi:hypothetical protein
MKAPATPRHAVGPVVTDDGNGESLFEVGWDPELQVAWRQLKDTDAQSREYSATISVAEGAANGDAVRAQWPDGVCLSVSALTVEQWRAKQDADGRAARSRSRANPVHYEGSRFKVKE